MKDIRFWVGADPEAVAPKRIADHLDDIGAYSTAIDPTPDGVQTYATRILVCCEDSKPFARLGADLRILWIMNNDPDTSCIDMADVVVFSSQAHMRDVRTRHRNVDPDKCVVLGLPCASAPKAKKEPFRIVYSSASERGLHHCLRIFTLLKSRVPQAELRVVGGIEHLLMHKYQVNSTGIAAVEVVSQMETPGVTFLGELSEVESLTEVATAQMLMYPCDPPSFSENFCTSIGEAVLADTIPVVSNADALAEVWGTTGCVLTVPVKHDEWADVCGHILQSRHYRRKIRKELAALVPNLTLAKVTSDWVKLISGLETAA